MRVIHMGISAVLIEFQGSSVLSFGGTPIPVIPIYDETEFGMSFGKSVVDVDGRLRCFFCFWKKYGRRHLSGDWKRAICVRESDVSERVRRVHCNRLLEI